MYTISRRDLLTASAGLAGIALVPGVLTAAEREQDKRPSEEPIEDALFTRIISSKVARLNGAGFCTETEARWPIGTANHLPVCVRLRITNHSDRPLLFSFFDTFSPFLYNGDGSEHTLDGGRDGTRIVMRPLLLEPGQDFSIAPKVYLQLNRDTEEVRVVYEDGTGTILHSGLLSEGEYALSFTYASVELQARTLATRLKRGAVWQGRVKTEPLHFRLVRVS